MCVLCYSVPSCKFNLHSFRVRAPTTAVQVILPADGPLQPPGLFKNLRGSEELEETEPRVPIFRVTYCLSDRVLLIWLLKSEPPISTSEDSADEREQEIDRGDHRSPVDFVAMYT
jgi:hypothetical protein